MGPNRPMAVRNMICKCVSFQFIYAIKTDDVARDLVFREKINLRVQFERIVQSEEGLPVDCHAVVTRLLSVGYP